MSTHCSVGVNVKNSGLYRVAYCQYDGYPEGVGKMLLEHYNSQDLAEKLTMLGDMSCLYESFERPEGHTFDSPVKGHCVFYHRDRGESWDRTAPIEGTDYKDIIADLEIEHDYLFDDGQWYVDGNPLTEVLGKES